MLGPKHHQDVPKGPQQSQLYEYCFITEYSELASARSTAPVPSASMGKPGAEVGILPSGRLPRLPVYLFPTINMIYPMNSPCSGGNIGEQSDDHGRRH